VASIHGGEGIMRCSTCSYREEEDVQGQLLHVITGLGWAR
jgi:hypothetical protein